VSFRSANRHKQAKDPCGSGSRPRQTIKDSGNTFNLAASKYQEPLTSVLLDNCEPHWKHIASGDSELPSEPKEKIAKDISINNIMLGQVAEPITQYQDRLLQDGGNETVGTDEPTGTSPPFNDQNEDNTSIIDDEGVQSFGIIFLAAFVVILLFVAWRFFKVWKVRRERYQLQMQSSRADAVLGDMQVSL
jgi:hypothetical protein